MAGSRASCNIEGMTTPLAALIITGGEDRSPSATYHWKALADPDGLHGYLRSKKLVKSFNRGKLRRLVGPGKITVGFELDLPDTPEGETLAQLIANDHPETHIMRIRPGSLAHDVIKPAL